MAIQLHILRKSARLTSFEDQIQFAFKEAIKRVEGKIRLSGVDVIICDNPDAAIPETGVGGYAPSAHLLYVSIDPGHPGLTERLKTEILSTLAHELHHCARWESVGYGKTLLEACISEGLADHFDIEVNGGEPKPWSIALQEEELEKAMAAAKEVFDAEYDENEWFWGTGDFPRWAAYSIGFALVANHIDKTGKSAGELVGINAQEFIGQL